MYIAGTIKDSKVRCTALKSTRILKQEWIHNSDDYYHHIIITLLLTRRNVFPNRFTVAAHAIRVQGIPPLPLHGNCTPFESSVAPFEN